MKLPIRFLFLFLFSYEIGFGAECFVSGVAVDKQQQPVAKASMTADSPPVGWEHLIVQYESSEDGTFAVPYPCKSRGIVLFATPPLDFENNFVPVSPPIYIRSKNYKLHSGHKLPWIKSGTFEIGKITLPQYHEIDIGFERAPGDPLFRTDIGPNIWLRIRPFRGAPVKQGNMSVKDRRNASKAGTSALRMILPEGEWIIEVSLNEDKGPYYYPDRIVNAGAIGVAGTRKVILQMGKEKAF